MSAQVQTKEASFKISDVVEITGLSKELVHHYLRLRLIPRSKHKAQYSHHQVRLLHLIKKLREEHHFPLEVVRQLFKRLEFDPCKLETLLLSESTTHRLTRFANGDGIHSPQTLTTREILTATSITLERLKEYVEHGLIIPSDDGDEQRFTSFDANIVLLCERGVEQGIPFETFSTIASYARLGFHLEHQALFQVQWSPETGIDKTLSLLFVRQEIVEQFVQNLLQRLIQHQLQQLLALPHFPAEAPCFDHVIFKPSVSFIHHHGLHVKIDHYRNRLSKESSKRASWGILAGLLLHTGAYREATFFLDQALQKWPEREDFLTLSGMAMTLAGNYQDGISVLSKVKTNRALLQLCSVYRALGQFGLASANQQSALNNAVALHRALEKALQNENQTRLPFHEKMICGWLLTTLPSSFNQFQRGRAILFELYNQATQADDIASIAESPIPSFANLPGLKQRLLINTAYLLLECSSRDSSSEAKKDDAIDLEELRVLICRLDPGCSFAKHVFLTGPR